MTIAQHPMRLFRLSCGCLRGYPMMPSGIAHEVLCARCRVPAVTVLVYPDRCCGARSLAVSSDGHRAVRVSCTVPRGQCDGTWHLDAIANVEFEAASPRLRAAIEGRTNRA
jgi:hypothetical protein